jgi:inorganic pyrophosphatase
MTNPYNISIISETYPSSIPAFIEVSQNSRMKYEWSPEMNSLVLDRILHSAVFYPHNYGFIPQTLCDDGDPLDVLVMTDAPIIPGCLVQVRPICYLVMEDEKGYDEKLLAIAEKDPHHNYIHTKEDIPSHKLNEITHFFETYKSLEKNKWTKIGDWKSTNDTHKLIQITHNKYKNKK